MAAIWNGIRPDGVCFLAALGLVNAVAVALIFLKRAPNLVVGLAFLCALGSHYAHYGVRGALIWVGLGVLLGGGLALFLYLRGFLGPGDVKLLAATGALLGPVKVFYAIFIAVATLALVDVASLGWHMRRRQAPLLQGGAALVAGAVDKTAPPVLSPLLRIPCGVAIVLGTNLALGLYPWLN